MGLVQVESKLEIKKSWSAKSDRVDLRFRFSEIESDRPNEISDLAIPQQEQHSERGCGASRIEGGDKKISRSAK